MPNRILASVSLSVVAGLVLVLVGVLLARPMIRDAVFDQLVQSADLELCEAQPATWGNSTGAFSLFAYDREGLSQNPQAPPIEADLLGEVLRTGRPRVQEISSDRQVGVYPGKPGGPCAVIRLNAGYANAAAFPRFLAVATASGIAGILVAVAGTFWFVILPFRARVRQLAVAAGHVGGDRYVGVDVDEGALGRIAGVLTDSHHRIVGTREVLEARNQALEDHLAGIAHDLRTPLASMQLALEAVAAEAEGARQAEARRAMADVVYLSSLVENLHQGTRLRHDIDVTAGPVDLADVVRRLEQRFAIVGRHADVQVAASVPEEAMWVACSPTLAERALANLIQNAIEHNPGEGHVAIVLERVGERFELLVDDDGPGLPQAVAASLEAESFLTDDARSRGPGLGMLITAEVARRAAWTLSYEPLSPKGLRVTVTGELVVPGTTGGA